MRLLLKNCFWIVLTASCVFANKFMDMPILILMVVAFIISLALNLWENHKFSQKLAQMAREIKERGNA